MFDEKVDKTLRYVCLEIEKRYQIKFLEIGTDEDHVHFLVQSIPMYSVTKEIFLLCPEVKKQLWGGEFWTDGYFGSTVSKHGDENMITNYVKKQSMEYQKLHQSYQLELF